jgi:hypothetical protein
MAQLLLENNPGVCNRVLRMFSSAALAMEAPRVKEMIGAATWEEKAPGFWVCKPSGDGDFYFSVEGWQVDR